MPLTRAFGILRGGTAFHFQVVLMGVAVFLFLGGLADAHYGDKVLSRVFFFYTPPSQEVYIQKNIHANNNAELLASGGSSPFLSAMVQVEADTVVGEDVEAYATVAATILLPTAQYTSLIATRSPEPSLTPVYKRTEIGTYLVKQGDTPSEIARAHGINLNTLLWANELSINGYIRPGDELIILPFDGLVHTVRSGETVGAIAARYGSTIEEVLTYNDIESSAFIVIGQNIMIPGGKKPIISAPRSYASSYGSLPSLNDYFMRPTDGRLSQGLHRYNAVDIAGGCWKPIYAAASGSVRIASGNGRWNGGFGNFVSIEHSNGTSTLYAHMIQVLSYGGQNVNKGEILGYTGSTGRSTGCHLHWEVRGAENPLARY